MFLMRRVFKKFKKKNSGMKLGKQLRNVGLDSNLISHRYTYEWFKKSSFIFKILLNIYYIYLIKV